MSQNQHHLAGPSSPASSTGSTPLYRMFRGFKSTQVIAPPSTSAAWRATLNDLKMLYLEGRWKECESRCLRLVGYSKGLPVIHAYLMFLIGCCVDMHARNLHQYSAGKTKKMEDAAVWFERCEAVLTNIDLDGESKIVDQDVVQTPENPAPKTNPPVEESDVSPLVQKKERIERLTRTISRLIDSDLDNPFGDETDPFLSNNSTPQRTSLSNFPNWYASQHRLTPSPLRIRKDHLTSQLDMLPSTPLSFGCVSTGTDCQDESMVSTPVQRDAAGLRCLASIMEDMSDCTWQSEKWNSAMGNGHDIQYVDAYELYSVHSGDSLSVDGEDVFTYQAAREARIEAKKEALRAEIERRVAQRMHRQEDHIVVSTSKFVASSEMQNAASSPFVSQNPSNRKGREMPRSLSDMIRDCLGKEEIVKIVDFCPRPIPHSSSARPLPLCVKPRGSMSSASGSESDKASLARLEHAWEVASFDGVYMIDSDCHSLRVVERTWAQLRTQYHLNKAASHEDIEAHITRFDDQISSLLYSVRHDILTLRQLANDIKNNRAQHLQAQKLPPSRSYWSFSTPFKDVTDENTNDDSGDNDHPHHKRKTMDMRLNSGWAAPGAVLNENKSARIKRLKREGFRTVGLRNEKRGHKGDEWYSYLCEEALRDIA